MWIRVRAFSRNTISIPLGIRYSLNLFSCIFASYANTKLECSNPTKHHMSHTILVRKRSNAINLRNDGLDLSKSGKMGCDLSTAQSITKRKFGYLCAFFINKHG